ncbi:MAG: lysylphosphatidylglycerol synthase transmembrane domain-containing protein [Bryobacteraceae bacterium]
MNTPETSAVPATPSNAAPSKMSAAKVVATLVALGLAGVLLYYSLRGISWGEVWILISGVKKEYLVLVCLLNTVALFLRAYRWRVLLSSAGPVSVSTAFWATSIGYFGNNFLPARAGELARTMMISTRAGLARAYVLTTALLERMVDALALVVISALVLLTLPSQPDWLGKATKPFAIVGTIGVISIALLPRLEKLGVEILRRLPIPDGIRDKLIGWLEHILDGFRAFHDAGRASTFLGLTIVIWCLDAVSAVTCAKGLGLDLPLPVAFLLITGLGLGSALPSTPGYVGIYQFVAVSILTPFGFRKADAIGYILMIQVVSYVLVGLWGSLGFWHFRRKPEEAPAAAMNQIV